MSHHAATVQDEYDVVSQRISFPGLKMRVVLFCIKECVPYTSAARHFGIRTCLVHQFMNDFMALFDCDGSYMDDDAYVSMSIVGN